MKCVHQWASTEERVPGGILVTVLRCRNCPKTLVQTYPPTGPGRRLDSKERRLAAAGGVRRQLVGSGPTSPR